MKKLTCLLLILAMVSCLALAEGDGLTAYEQPITVTTARTMTETAVFDANDPSKKSYQENLWTDTFRNELNIDLKYDWVATDGSADMSKWSAAIATSMVPDFARVDGSIYKLLLDADLMADCTDLYAQYATEEYKALLNDSLLSQMTYGGRLMGLPFPNKGYMGATMLFVRQDWLDRLGLSYPTNYEEIVSVAKAFKEAKLGGEGTQGLMFSWNTSDGKLDGLMNMFGAFRDYWLEKDGRLEFSNVQPEMRDALLELQKLYADGLINQDFAVTTADLSKEYIAGGKCGIFFATSWNTTTSIQALYDNDPEANVVSHVIFGRDGGDILFQTNAPTVGRVFVSANSEHPEAVMKMLNLSYQLTTDEYEKYGVDATGHMWFKYLPFGDMPRSALTDILNAHEIAVAYQQGVTDGSGFNWTDPTNSARYEKYLASVAGEGTTWYKLTYGVDGVYSKLYDAYMAGLQLSNAYLGLPTETQELMGDVINDQLNSAMIDVIMGADISVFDAACEAWLSNGGAAIQEEVNEASGR